MNSVPDLENLGQLINFQIKTVHSGAPSCANREVLEVDRLNFWIFLPVDLKQCHCPVVASHLKHCN